MSKESAGKFVGAYGTDPAIEKAVKALPEGEDSFEAMAGVGASLGYDFTAEELARAFSARLQAERAAIEGQELSDEELNQVAGGKGKDECKDTYDGKCWFNDSCTSTWHYYKAREACESTVTRDGDCFFVENCTFAVMAN